MVNASYQSERFDPRKAYECLRKLKPEELDFKVVNQPLEKVVRKVLERLKSEQRQPTRFYFIILCLLETCLDTYRAIRKLVAEEPKYPAQAHVLCRSMLDAVFNVAALCDNPCRNSERYEKAGWRDLQRTLQRQMDLIRDDAQWAPLCQHYQAFLGSAAEVAGLSADERSNPDAIQFWPTPSRMLRGGMLSAGLREFLKRLLDEEYDPYSGQAHVHWIGIVMGMFAKRTGAQVHPGMVESGAVYIGLL